MVWLMKTSRTGNLSRERPVNPVTCCDERLRAADLDEWSFGCFTLVRVDAAGSPREAPKDPTADGHSFGSMQSVGMRFGLVTVHPWSA